MLTHHLRKRIPKEGRRGIFVGRRYRDRREVAISIRGRVRGGLLRDPASVFAAARVRLIAVFHR